MTRKIFCRKTLIWPSVSRARPMRRLGDDLFQKMAVLKEGTTDEFEYPLVQDGEKRGRSRASAFIRKRGLPVDQADDQITSLTFWLSTCTESTP